MKLCKCIEILAVGMFFFSEAMPEDLEDRIILDVKDQCGITGYQDCVSALRLHGLGQDDDAITVRVANLPKPQKKLYEVAETRLQNFWTLVATAGGKSNDCAGDLSTPLDNHLTWNPDALSDAIDDLTRNKFLALSDLLAVPPGSPPDWPKYDAQLCRYCFSNPTSLFEAVKAKLSMSKPAKSSGK